MNSLPGSVRLTPDIKARVVGSELLKEKFVDAEETASHGGAVGRCLKQEDIHHLNIE